MTQKEQRGREHVAAWRASGLTQRQYCEQHNYSRSSLGYWSWKINAEQKQSGLVEISSGSPKSPSVATSTTVELWVGNRYRLRLAEGFSCEALQQLLDVIEKR